MKPISVPSRSLTLQFALLAAGLHPFCFAQVPAPPAAPPAAPQATTQTDQDNSTDLIALISANTNVPRACVLHFTTILSEQQAQRDRDLRATIDFAGNQLCPLYLVLSSIQYQKASQAVRDSILKNWLSNPITLQLALKAYKTMSQQTGSSSGTGGTTNLVSKGVAARLLSFANEYGALTESTSGQTTTVAGSLAGVPLLLFKNGLIQNCSTEIYSFALKVCANASVVDYLSRISYSVAFDTSVNGQTLTGTTSTSTTSSAVPVTFTASAHSINALTAKWVIVQGKPASPDVQTAVKNLEDTNAAGKAVALAQFFDLLELQQGARFTDWQNKSFNTLRDAMESDIEADAKRPDGGKTKNDVTNTANAFRGLADTFVDALGLPVNATGKEAAQSPVITNAVQFAAAYAAYTGQEEAVSAAIPRPAVLSFEYDDNRPANQPSNSVFRLIYQAKVKEITLTANGAASIYDSAPSSSIPGAGRLRDVQLALGADRNFSVTLPFTGKVGMTASGNFYFQNQQSPAILNVTPSSPVNGITFTGLPANATQVFAQKGNIGVGQLKLTIGSGSSINVPISVTYSNRTELVTSPVWRGQVGISYDFDSLFQPKQ